MAPLTHALQIDGVRHRYGERVAVQGLDLTVSAGEIFVFLGPNGGGKTTLFRLISTLIPVQEGTISLFGFDVTSQTTAVRERIGVVFQAPSLDKKMTVWENLRDHGQLYGICGPELKSRQNEMLHRLGLSDRAHERVERLSGGLRRRVELAKGMLPRPQLLLLDEPSTGLDPGARNDLWKYLRQIRENEGVTIVLTTHLLEEAEQADRIAILHEGKLVALDTPSALKTTVGGDSITITTAHPVELANSIREKFHCPATVIEGRVRIEQPRGHEWIAKLCEAFPGQIQTITLGQPTLADVFIDRTGHAYWADGREPSDA